MDVYGLTGGIGSGKSTVAEMLEAYGVPVVSADELSRIVVARGSEGLADVVQRFGPGVLDEHGDLDRRRMAALVFQDPNKRRELEAILHPRIRERFEQVLDALEKAGHEVAIYEVPLLFEKNLQGEMKAVILITADDSVRTARVRTRDDITATEVRARMATQMSEAAKRRKADYVIENNGSIDDLRREVEFLLVRFLRLGSEGDAEPDASIDPTASAEASRIDTVMPAASPALASPPPSPPAPPASHEATLPPSPLPEVTKGGTLPPIATTPLVSPTKGGTLPPVVPPQPPSQQPTVIPGRDQSTPAPPPPLQHTQRVPPVPPASSTSPRSRPRPDELQPTVPDDEPDASDP
jgi:dephospho-CoA kinase